MENFFYKFSKLLLIIKRYLLYIRDLFYGNGPYASKYTFIDRKKNLSKVLYVLAGYKPYLWDDVFTRINKFIPNDVEVCILSSGKYDKKLNDICDQYEWSYLSTVRNNICIITNIFMKLYDKAEFIYKMDEDMYVTKDCFTELESLYHKLEKEGKYHIGVVGPFVPLNSFCLYDFLKSQNVLVDFERKFGQFRKGTDARFRSNIGIDSYVWNITGNIDQFALTCHEQNSEYSTCDVRYMIGFILFKRSLWEEMGPFRVSVGKGSGTEGDEGQLITYCALSGKIFACANRVVVGHFSFGGAEESVLHLKAEHPEFFSLSLSQ